MLDCKTSILALQGYALGLHSQGLRTEGLLPTHALRGYRW